MHICMLIKLQLEAAECLKIKDVPSAFAVFTERSIDTASIMRSAVLPGRYRRVLASAGPLGPSGCSWLANPVGSP